METGKIKKVNTRQRGKSWSYYFDTAKIDGKRKKIEKGGFESEEAAYLAGVKAYDEYNTSGDVFKASELSVSDFMDIWYNKVKADVRNNTQENYEKMIRVHIKPDLGGYKLKALTPKAVDDWCVAKRKRNLAYSTVDNMLKVLKKALDYAVYPCNYIKDNPARLIKVSKGKRLAENERRIISQEEMKKILERFPFGTSYYIPFMVGFYCGLRIGEVLGLTWDDINLVDGNITVNKQLQRVIGNGGKWILTDTKTESSVRTIAMPTILTTTLKRWKAQQSANEIKYGSYYKHTYLVTDKDNVGNPVNRVIEQQKILPPVGKRIELVCLAEDGSHIKQPSFSYTNKIIRDELKIDRFDFHSLRHTAATMLIENGANIKDVSERLGHSSIDTTMDTYTHNTEKIKRETVGIIERVANVK